MRFSFILKTFLEDKNTFDNNIYYYNGMLNALRDPCGITIRGEGIQREGEDFFLSSSVLHRYSIV